MANYTCPFRPGHVGVDVRVYQSQLRISFQQNTILHSPAHSRATSPEPQHISNIKATMPPKGPKGSKAPEATNKRDPTPRQATVGTSNSGTYTTASKYVRDVHHHRLPQRTNHHRLQANTSTFRDLLQPRNNPRSPLSPLSAVERSLRQSQKTKKSLSNPVSVHFRQG